MAKHVPYYEFDREGPIVCPHCDAVGSYANWAEYYDELFDITCGKCGVMLFIVSYPTFKEVRDWAARGHPGAIADLPSLDERETFLARATASQPKSADELPELEGDRLAFVWAFQPEEDEHGDRVVAVSLGETELWREVAFWEGYERFDELRELLRERYGDRFSSLTPTEASYLYLLGDKSVTISTT